MQTSIHGKTPGKALMRVRLSVVKGGEAPQLFVWDAGSVRLARVRAEQAGYTVIQAQAAFSLLNWASWRQGSGQHESMHSTADLLVWVEQLHSLLVAGLSVIEVLQTLQRQRSDKWLPVMQAIETRLRQGLPLSAAMEAQPVFPALLVALVRTAEVTSDLPQALDRYLDHERRAASVRHQITSIAVYPLMLLGVGGSVLLFLLFYVMPRFARIFQGMHGDLPWTAQAMVAWAHLLKDHGPWVWASLMSLAAVGAAFWWIPRLRAGVLRWFMSYPWLAQRLEIYHLSRWYRTTSMLVRGGIPLPESLQVATQVLPVFLQSRAHAVTQAMRDGLPPAQAYMVGDMATAVAEQLIQAGERSGDVGTMLEKAAEFHQVELTRSLERTMRVLEPVVMALIGLGVGGVVIMMYLPIFELASAVQ